MKAWKIVLALLLCVGTAHADFGAGTQVVDIPSGRTYSQTIRVEKGQNVMVAVSGSDGLKLTCGVRDRDDEIVTATRGDGCVMSFDAGYSGKYRAQVVNRGSEDVRVAVTVSF